MKLLKLDEMVGKTVARVLLDTDRHGETDAIVLSFADATAGVFLVSPTNSDGTVVDIFTGGNKRIERAVEALLKVQA